MKITYYGHSCFSVLIGNTNLLFDPFITNNPLAKDINVESIKADYILISHGHEDHIADVPLILKNNPNSILISSFEIVNYYIKTHYLANYKYLGIGGTIDLGSFSVEMAPAVHSSSFPDGSYAGLAAGFIIDDNKNRIYYAGDTSIFTDMRLISEIKPLTLAILPIGNIFTMCIQKALKSAELLNVNKIMGVHYNTFPLIEINLLDAVNLFSKKQKELLLPKIGATIEL
ncbi:MAG: metal-dependent hydrolase [Solitalea-like symbiont of Acarus siro]